MSIRKAGKEFGYFLWQFITAKSGVERTVNHFRIKFPARWSRYYPSDYEAINYDFLRAQAKPGMHIIDIGAHLGLFSVASSQLVGAGGKIICFEPTAGTYSVLLKTLKLNDCNNVISVRGAVSDKEGTAVFYVSETAGCNSNSLVKDLPGQQSTGNEVRLYVVDNITPEYSLRPGLIKIDAEGAEFDILQGSAITLREYKPVLILGLHPEFITQKGDSLEKIWDLLHQSGYRVQEAGRDLAKADFCGRTTLFDVHCI